MAVTVTVDQLGAELKRRREELGISLRTVEHDTKISAATLSRVERGSVPDIPIIERLATWLGVNVCAVGEEIQTVQTDEDLKRAIAVHLRANKSLPETVARAIVESFDLVMRVELERAVKQGLVPKSGRLK
jgi:transcriptional regulator with XRE-family HTH domain